MQKKENSVIDILRDDGTVERVDVTKEINKIIEIARKNNVKTEINNQLNYLDSFVSTNMRIINASMKLHNIYNSKGIDIEFTEQINYISNLFDSISIDYKPINENFIDLYNNQEIADGISLLNSDLDERTGGLHPGEVATIVGGSGSMKTTYAINICYQAIKQGKNVCFLSLEETPLTLYSKLLSRASVDLNKNFSVQDIIQHKLSSEDTKILKEEVYPYLESLPGKFYILNETDLGDFSQNTIMKKLEYIDKLIKDNSKDETELNHGIDIIVVDHMQMFKYVVTEKKDEYQIMNMYVSFFRKMSKHFIYEGREVLVMLLSQCNREGIAYAKRNDGTYLMQHVAEASEIERSSSYIISVYTDEFSQISKHIKIGAVKLRDSSLPMGTSNTFADGKYYQIGENHNPKVKDYKADDLDLDNQSLNDLDSMLKPNIIF